MHVNLYNQFVFAYFADQRNLGNLIIFFSKILTLSLPVIRCAIPRDDTIYIRTAKSRKRSENLLLKHNNLSSYTQIDRLSTCGAPVIDVESLNFFKFFGKERVKVHFWSMFLFITTEYENVNTKTGEEILVKK